MYCHLYVDTYISKYITSKNTSVFADYHRPRYVSPVITRSQKITRYRKYISTTTSK